ncbi:caspase-9 isoform X1 [Pantherophis guttatus]|uniref:Caspase-9 isoform X1 n=1 Tax=Pantherophis guttatus TaxID=94885 RepID=A0A6P9C9U5_PANGU|nr:caspase-9 isoform X1 [Pantherophis guttatus]
MEEADRRRLLRSRVRLVKELRLEPLWAPLLRRGLFTADMIEEIQSAGTRRDQARQLVGDVATRGRRALGDFVLCLRESGQEALAELLSDGRRPEGPPEQPPRHPEAHRPLPGKAPPHQPSQPDPVGEKPKMDSEMVYPLNSEPCGYCLIINNVHFDKDTDLKRRLGSDIDRQRLEKRFQALHFEVLTKEDLTAQEIAQELQSLAGRDHSSLDCCMVVILSHGCESYHIQIPGAIIGTDGQRIPVQKVVSYFNGSHCPSLRGKPKLFLIQACGGEEKDQGFEMEADTPPGRREGNAMESDATPMPGPGGDSDELDATASLPTDSDILVCYPTFPGHVSWRDTQSGSWFIEALDQVLAEYAHLEDLPSILTKVGNIVAAKVAGPYKQMPGHFNFLRKKFFFKA